LLVVLLLVLSITVAPAITTPLEALVTTPLTAPVVGVRLKLTLWVVWPAVTVTVTVWEVKPLADAVRV
jgi:hypothetical protein